MELLSNNHLTHLKTIYSHENKFSKQIHIIFKENNVQEIITSLSAFNLNPLPFTINAYSLDDAQEQTLITETQKLHNSPDHLIYIGGFAGQKALFDSYQLTGKTYRMVCLLSALAQNSAASHFIELSKPYLKVLHLIGNQIHLSDEHLLRQQSKIGLKLGLGQLNYKLEIAEPLLRSAQLCCLDMTVLANHQVLDASSVFSSTGMNTQQLAQCLYYYGRGSFAEMLAIDISELSLPANHNLVATMLWYYMYGLSMQQPITPETFDEYLVTIDSPFGDELGFLKDQKNQHWWLRNPLHNHNDWDFIPCDYQNYVHATAGELDDYLLQMIDLFQPD